MQHLPIGQIIHVLSDHVTHVVNNPNFLIKVVIQVAGARFHTHTKKRKFRLIASLVTADKSREPDSLAGGGLVEGVADVDDESIPDVGLGKALHGRVHVLGADHLDVRRHVVLGREVQHLLGVPHAANEAPGQGLVRCTYNAPHVSQYVYQSVTHTTKCLWSIMQCHGFLKLLGQPLPRSSGGLLHELCSANITFM
jgi:hypothetical protein